MYRMVLVPVAPSDLVSDRRQSLDRREARRRGRLGGRRGVGGEEVLAGLAVEVLIEIDQSAWVFIVCGLSGFLGLVWIHSRRRHR